MAKLIAQDGWLKKLQQWFFPPICILCRQLSDISQDMCSACEGDLPFISRACRQCGQALHKESATADNLCGDCLKNPPIYDRTFALCHYSSPMDHLIAAAKFQNKLTHTRVLGELMAKRIKNQWYADQPLPELIIPVPLHPQRLQARGYNQALEIAKPLAKRLGIPLDYYRCQRIKATAAQASLRSKERSANIRGAFNVVEPYRVTHVALLDDVVTTGHTMAEISRVLKAAGIDRIDVWCCARTDIGHYDTQSKEFKASLFRTKS